MNEAIGFVPIEPTSMSGAKAAGAAAILRKSFSCGELLETVDTLQRCRPG